MLCPRSCPAHTYDHTHAHTHASAHALLMSMLHPQARKDVASIYNFVLRQRKQASIDYVKSHPEILKSLVEGYSDSEIALNCGSILREGTDTCSVCAMRVHGGGGLMLRTCASRDVLWRCIHCCLLFDMSSFHVYVTVIRHEELNEMLLNSPLFDLFFDYVQLSTFDVASDAFATFKVEADAWV